jgi:hypothetical protein
MYNNIIITSFRDITKPVILRRYTEFVETKIPTFCGIKKGQKFWVFRVDVITWTSWDVALICKTKPVITRVPLIGTETEKLLLRLVLAIQSWPSCPGCPVTAVLPWLACSSSPVLTVLNWQFWSACCVLHAILWLYRSFCPVLFVQFWLSCPGSCPGCSLPAGLSQPFCSGCPVPAVLPWIYYACPGCILLTVLLSRPVLAALSWQYSPDCPAKPSCPCSPVLAILFRQFRLAVLFWQSFPGIPALQ